jgi:hypothetical protein
MDKLKPSLTPGFLVAFGILCITFALFFIMAVVTATNAHAQQLLCVPGDALIRQTMEVKKEHPVWEGTIPVDGQPPAEAVLTQSEKGGWSFFLIQNGTACLLFAGTDANPPINPGKGA